MTLLQAIVLGAVQGLTEFVPVSSSAHLILVPWLFSWPAPGLAFDVALHLGTLLAVLAYFWRDLLAMLAAGLRSLATRRLDDPQARLAWVIALGTIPAVIAGALFDDALEAFFHDPNGGPGTLPILLIALLLGALGLVLWLAERLARHVRGLDSIGWRDGLLIGLAQALALLPGVSRSGSTLTAGLALGLRRDDAARFSFLLSVPIIIGAGAKKLFDVAQAGGFEQEPLLFAAGVLTAAVVGYLSIHFLLRFLRRDSADVFAYYRWVLAAALVALALLR
jgi:undecaprenyl-diphosphatase